MSHYSDSRRRRPNIPARWLVHHRCSVHVHGRPCACRARAQKGTVGVCKTPARRPEGQGRFVHVCGRFFLIVHVHKMGRAAFAKPQLDDLRALSVPCTCAMGWRRVARVDHKRRKTPRDSSMRATNDGEPAPQNHGNGKPPSAIGHIYAPSERFAICGHCRRRKMRAPSRGFAL